MTASGVAQRTELRAPAAHGVSVRERVADPAVIAAVALTIVAAVLRFWRIGHQGFWFDEGNTALLVHFSPGNMIGLIPRSESTPPLYYCLAWIWVRIFGYGEAALRSLSALAGVATVPVAFATARKLFGNRTAVVVGALVACNPLLIWYSQEARSYALLVLLTSLSLLALVHAREDPSPRRLTLWVLASALALATHYYAILAILPQTIWLLVEHRRRRSVLWAVGAVAACGLALIPLALHQNATGRGNWISTVPLIRRVNEVVPDFLTAFNLPAQAVLVPLAGALAVFGLVLVLWRGDARARRLALVTAALALGGFILNLLLVAGGVDDLLTRNDLALWLPAALTVAAGLGARRAGLAGVAATIALCAIGVTGAVAVATNRDYQRPDWRGVARLLGTRPAPGVGERLILIQHYRDLLPLSLYLPGLHFTSRAGARVRELDVVTFTSPPSHGFCWYGAACNLWPSAMQATYAVPGFHQVWRRRVYQFTVARYMSDVPRRITHRGIARVLTVTNFRNDELLVQR
jgi:4-amino-4-deoxy-L-arabinose transferase-like glycosyltransferase